MILKEDYSKEFDKKRRMAYDTLIGDLKIYEETTCAD